MTAGSGSCRWSTTIWWIPSLLTWGTPARRSTSSPRARHPHDAAFMSLPEDSDPPTDQGSALWCLCDLHMPLGGVKQAAKALVREPILVQRASSQ